MSIPTAYTIVLLVWSTTPLAIVWSNESFSPMAAASLRLLVSLSIMLLLRVALKLAALDIRRLWKLYAVSAMGLFPGLALVYWAAPLMSSSLMSVLYGLLPFFVAGVDWAIFGRKSVHMGQVVAVALAFFGLVLLLSAGDADAGISYLGVLLVISAVVVNAFSVLLVKDYAADVDAINVLTGALLFATPIFILAWIFGGADIPETPDSRALYAILYLGVMGSAVAYVAYIYLLKRVSAVGVSLIPMITPAVAVVLGASFNSEQFSPQLIVGMLCILSGIWLYQLLGQRRFNSFKNPHG